MKPLYFLFLSVALIAGYNIGLNQGRFTQPFEVHFEKITDADLARCKADENCMDILAFEGKKLND